MLIVQNGGLCAFVCEGNYDEKHISFSLFFFFFFNGLKKHLQILICCRLITLVFVSRWLKVPCCVGSVQD